MSRHGLFQQALMPSVMAMLPGYNPDLQIKKLVRALLGKQAWKMAVQLLFGTNGKGKNQIVGKEARRVFSAFLNSQGEEAFTVLIALADNCHWQHQPVVQDASGRVTCLQIYSGEFLVFSGDVVVMINEIVRQYEERLHRVFVPLFKSA